MRISDWSSDVCSSDLESSGRNVSWPGVRIRSWAGELDRELQRGAQAAGVGFAAAGQIERGAVIDRRANDRQAKRDVDGLSEAGVFEYRQSLVVIHRQIGRAHV